MPWDRFAKLKKKITRYSAGPFFSLISWRRVMLSIIGRKAHVRFHKVAFEMGRSIGGMWAKVSVYMRAVDAWRRLNFQ